MENRILNRNVRLGIYITAGIVNLLSAYFISVGTIGIEEAALINGINVFVCGLAGVNVPSSDKQ